MKALRLLPLLIFLSGPALALPRLGEPDEGNEAVEIQKRANFFYKRRALPDGTFAPQARVRALGALSGIGISPLQMRRRITPLGSVPIPYPWEEIGPKPAGESGYGFLKASGRVNSIAVDPSHPEIVYIGGAFAGVAKSIDSGANWTYLTGAMPSQAVSSVVLDPADPSIVYAGTGDPYYSGNGQSLLGVGVYRSTDSGATWGTISANDLGGGVVRKLVVDPASTGSWTATRLLAAVSNGTAAGIYRSLDSGLTWTRTWTDDCFDVIVDTTNPTRAYFLCASAVNGVKASDDFGATWGTYPAIMGNPSDQPLPLNRKGRLAMNGSKLYMVFGAGSYSNPAFGTDPGQGGELWIASDPVISSASHFTGADGFCDAQCFYDIYVGVDPNDPGHIFLGGVDASVSTDGGSTFTDFAPFNPPNMTLHSDHHSIAFAPSNPAVIYEGNDGGMYRSDDHGSTWSNLNQNLSGGQLIGVGVSGDGRVIGGLQDNGGVIYTSGTSTRWEMVGGGDGGFNRIDPSNSRKYYYTYVVAGPVTGGLLTRTADDNATITDITPAAAINTETAEFYPAFFMSPSNSDHLLFGGQHVYRSVNGGGAWARVGSLSTPQSLDVVSAVVEAPSNPAVVYAAVDGTYGSLQSGVFVTTNATSGNSATWFPAPNVTSSILPSDQVPTAIAVHPTLSSTAYVTYSQYGTSGSPKHHIYKTVDYGVTWALSDTGLPDVPFNDILIDPSVPTHVFAASDVGVFASQDSGATWARSDVGMPKGTIANALAIHPGTRELVVGSYGMGAYRLTLDPAPPPAPLGLAAAGAGVSSVTWTWGLVASATGYLFYPSTGGPAIALTGTSVTLTDLSTNTAYSGRVSAANIGGEGALSAAATGYSLAAPPAASAFSGVGVTSVTVQWDAQGNPPGTIYEVGKWKVGVATTVQTTTLTSAVVTGLAANTTYYFRVRAKNGQNVFSAPDAFLSAVTLRPPPSVAPSGFVAASLDTSTVRFTWKPVAGATGYEFYPATGSVLQTATTGILLTGISTAAAAGGKVAATAYGGHGPLTATVTGYAAAAGPTGTTAAAVFFSSAAISWDPAGNPVGTKFKIEYYKWATPATILSKIVASTDAFSDSAVITSLTPNTSYYARVRALNAKLIATAPDAAVTVLTRPLKPTAAPSVTVSPVATTPIAAMSIGSITWTWKAVPGAQFYNFYPLVGGATAAPTVVVATSTELTGLALNTAYGARVQVGNETGLGPLSPIVTGYTLADTPNGTSAVVSVSSVALTWNAGGNSSTVGYRVEYKKSSAAVWSVVTATASAFGVWPTESKTVTGLAANTSYDFRVRALNAKLVPGIPDAVVTAVTQPPKPAAAPKVSFVLASSAPITSLTAGSATWTWSAVPNASFYLFQPSTGGAPIVTSGRMVTLEGLGSAAAYGAKVQAGNATGLGPLSATVTGYTLADVPANLSLFQNFVTSMTLSWDYGTNPPFALDYTVEYWTEPAASTGIYRVHNGSTAFLTGLSAATTYYFRVRGINQQNVLGLPGYFVGRTHNTDGSVPLRVAAAPTWNWMIPAAQPAPAPAPSAPPASSSALAKIVAFPNPLLAGQPGVNFVSLPAGAAIRITNAAGLLMRAYTSTGGGSWTWNAADSRGKSVPAGTYAAAIESGGARRVIDVEVRR